MSKRYRLIKKLPDAEIGTIITLDEDDDECTYDYTSKGGEASWYRKQYVENNPEWFELIPETIPDKEFKWTDELVKDFVADKGKYMTVPDIIMEAINQYKKYKKLPQSHAIKNDDLPQGVNTVIASSHRDDNIYFLIENRKEKLSKDFIQLAYQYNLTNGNIYKLDSITENFPPTEKEQPTDIQQGKEWEQIPHEAKLWVAADILSRIWFYGGFKIETANERTLAGILNELGLFPTTEEKIFNRPGYEDYDQRFINYQLPKTNANK